MKFNLSALVSAFFIGAASAQHINIGAPSDGATVTAGSSIVVEIDRPSFQSSAVEVAVVLGIASCATGCPTEILGSLLFNGPYDPERHPGDSPQKPPYQNFTVTVPEFLSGSLAQLSAFHVSLIGASLEPFTEVKTLTLNVL